MIIATDIETYKLDEDGLYKPILDSREYICGCVVDEKGKEMYFDDKKKHWEYILALAERLRKRKSKLYIYGHNHLYDMYGYLPKNIFTSEKFKLILSRPVLAKYGENIFFCDTGSFYRGSLDDMGKSIGFEKGVMPESVKVPSELKEYCMQDCRIALKYMLNLKGLLSELGYNPRKMLTAGSTSMSTFLTYCRKNGLHWNFMRNGEIFRSPHFRETRFALRGGRCDAFQKGTFENCTLMDINSMYSNVMANTLNNEFPDLKEYVYLKTPPLSDWEFISQLTGTIECTIEVNTDEVPFLPIKFKDYQATPSNSRIRGRWTIPEIVYALSLKGHKLTSIHWVEVYKKSKVNPFTHFIKDLFELGKKNPEYKPATKLLQNNLFGKFAQFKWIMDTKYIYRDQIQSYEDQGYIFDGLLNEKVIMKKKIGEYVAKFTNPLISSLITGFARINLHKELIKIPKEDLLYTDTDSILFKGNHQHLFNVSEELGAFKVEKQGTATIFGEKDYRIEDKISISGLPKRSLTDETWNKDVIQMKRQIGFNQAVKRNDMSIMGSFEDIEFTRSKTSKTSLKFPAYIDERQYYEDKQ